MYFTVTQNGTLRWIPPAVGTPAFPPLEDRPVRIALPKAMFWIGSVSMLGHIVSALLPTALRALLQPEELATAGTAPIVPAIISDGALIAATRFAARRYIFGQAVLARSCVERAWLSKDASRSHTPSTDEELVVKLLRRSVAATIRFEDLLEAEGDLERAFRKVRSELRSPPNMFPSTPNTGPPTLQGPCAREQVSEHSFRTRLSAPNTRTRLRAHRLSRLVQFRTQCTRLRTRVRGTSKLRTLRHSRSACSRSALGARFPERGLRP